MNLETQFYENCVDQKKLAAPNSMNLVSKAYKHEALCLVIES